MVNSFLLYLLVYATESYYIERYFYLQMKNRSIIQIIIPKYSLENTNNLF